MDEACCRFQKPPQPQVEANPCVRAVKASLRVMLFQQVAMQAYRREMKLLISGHSSIQILTSQHLLVDFKKLLGNSSHGEIAYPLAAVRAFSETAHLNNFVGDGIGLSRHQVASFRGTD